MTSRHDHEFCIIGGGFYGLCLSLFLRAGGARVAVYEASEAVCTRASRVNQARIHTGFHYPRSFVTAMRSLLLHQRFAEDFPSAVVDNFDMLYAVARRRSKVSTARFRHMFDHLGAPFDAAPQHLSNLFDAELIDGVFRTKEWAFDYRELASRLSELVQSAGVQLHLGVEVASVEQLDDGIGLLLRDGRHRSAELAFNCTYSNLNALLSASRLETLPLKHELVELALVTPPEEMKGLGVTVMDGPFFSIMPYPAKDRYSLSHVRYTPHWSWSDSELAPNFSPADLPRQSRWRHMKQDAQRYMPCLSRTMWSESLFDVKTVAMKNERNDGRPIFLHRHNDAPSLVSILGGKIDNIYDLFAALPLLDQRFAHVESRSLFAEQRI